MGYELDMKAFWATNERCKDLRKDIPRVPVEIYLDGDWICELLGLDNARYYSEYRYQQDGRLRCSKITEAELALPIRPSIDFGVVMDASIYGGRVNYESNATPTLAPVVQDPAEIDALVERMEKADLLACGLVPKYLEWREKLRSEYGLTLTYGGGIKGCATTLGQICGITNFLTWIATDPEQIRKLIDCWRRTAERYLRLMRQVTGYAAERPSLAFASDLSGMLSPEMYRDFIMPAEKALYDTFASGPDAVRFYHSDYRMLHHLDTFREMGVNEVNIDPYITPRQILAKLPDAVVHGQIPPLTVLLNGKPEDVVACVRRDIEEAGPGKHLVITTAGSIDPGTSFENLRAICYAAEKYGYIYGHKPTG